VNSQSYRPFTKTSNRLSASVSLLAVAISLASVGVQATDEAIFLEEIVVTAQKRAQNLQDVPVAISAVSGDQIVEAAIQDIFDLQTSTPGLRVGQATTGSSTTFAIRGIGSNSSNFGVESSVGLYVDGVYRARQSSMINDMIDMEAVEVLRGPQGTLFGKNTAAGAVHFRTKAPSHETDGFVSATAGNRGMQNFSAAGNLSVVEDVLVLRGTAFSSERDGYIDAEGFGDNVLNNRDRWGTRLQALITPTDDLSIRVIADYSKIGEVCCGVVGIGDNLTVADGYVSTDSILQDLGATVYEGDVSDSYATSVNVLPEASSKDRGLSVEVNWDQGDYTYTSVTAYRKYNSTDYQDSDFSNADLFNTGSDAGLENFSQELRLSFVSDNMNAVVGAFYSQQDLDLVYSLDTGTQLSEFIQAAEGIDEFVAGFDALSAGFTAAGADGLTIAPGVAFDDPAFAPSADPFDGLAGGHNAKQESTSWALFGQFDYNFSEDIILTAGLRYTEEKKKLSTTFSEYLDGELLVDGPVISGSDIAATGDLLGDVQSNPLLLLAPAYAAQFDAYRSRGWGQHLFGSLTPRVDENDNLDDSQISGTLKLSWFVAEDVMTYASYGTGYKSGGLNTDRIPVGVEASFAAETTESFELGVKAELPDQALRVNAALHYTIMNDFQSNSFNGDSYVLRNAGKFATSGIELETFWQPAQNTEVSFGYAYTQKEFKSFENSSCWVATPALTGVNDPSLTVINGKDVCSRTGAKDPLHFANLGLKQSFTLADSAEGYVFGEYAYLSSQGKSGDPMKQREGYGLLNLRAGVYFDESQLNLTLWGRNVLNNHYNGGGSFDAPIQDGKLIGFGGSPATYGITLNKDF